MIDAIVTLAEGGCCRVLQRQPVIPRTPPLPCAVVRVEVDVSRQRFVSLLPLD